MAMACASLLTVFAYYTSETLCETGELEVGIDGVGEYGASDFVW